MSQQPAGDHYMGERARDQLRVARHDPRLARADFWDALEEVERIRTLSVLGLHELAQAYVRDYGETSPGAGPGGPSKAEQKSWERSAWAQAELEAGYPHINAQALISMNSALDAMVEELVDFWRPKLVDLLVTRLYDVAQASTKAAGNRPPRATKSATLFVRNSRGEVVSRAVASAVMSRYWRRSVSPLLSTDRSPETSTSRSRNSAPYAMSWSTAQDVLMPERSSKRQRCSVLSARSSGWGLMTFDGTQQRCAAMPRRSGSEASALGLRYLTKSTGRFSRSGATTT
jgi:hypothetical protein